MCPRQLRPGSSPGCSGGESGSEVRQALDEILDRRLIARIWAKDHTVWKPQPEEIVNRLGWLTVPVVSEQQVPQLRELAVASRSRGIRDVVLLGMGGSSLAPEVLRLTFGARRGWPRLHVLDSTVPGWVERVAGAVDPRCTLFLVSSKSGGTIEVISFFRYFFDLAQHTIGPHAGEHFVAITDPGTGLEQLAQQNGFLQVFLNPPDIGGRFSALSQFGLVPAALVGIDPHPNPPGTGHADGDVLRPGNPARQEPGRRPWRLAGGGPPFRTR